MRAFLTAYQDYLILIGLAIFFGVLYFVGTRRVIKTRAMKRRMGR